MGRRAVWGGRAVGSEAPPLAFPPREGCACSGSNPEPAPDTPLSDTDFLPFHWKLNLAKQKAPSSYELHSGKAPGTGGLHSRLRSPGGGHNPTRMPGCSRLLGLGAEFPAPPSQPFQLLEAKTYLQ